MLIKRTKLARCRICIFDCCGTRLVSKINKASVFPSFYTSVQHPRARVEPMLMHPCPLPSGFSRCRFADTSLDITSFFVSLYRSSPLPHPSVFFHPGPGVFLINVCVTLTCSAQNSTFAYESRVNLKWMHEANRNSNEMDSPSVKLRKGKKT